MKKSRGQKILIKREKSKIKKEKQKRFQYLVKNYYKSNREFSSIAENVMKEKMPGLSSLFTSLDINDITESVDYFMAVSDATKEVYGKA